MLLSPKKPKWSKSYNSRKNPVGSLHRMKRVNNADFGFVLKDSCNLSSKQLITIQNNIKLLKNRTFYVWFEPRSILPVTKRQDSVRMGKGKQTVRYWSNNFRSGSILISIKNNNRADSTRRLKEKITKIISSKLFTSYRCLL